MLLLSFIMFSSLLGVNMLSLPAHCQPNMFSRGAICALCCLNMLLFIVLYSTLEHLKLQSSEVTPLFERFFEHKVFGSKATVKQLRELARVSSCLVSLRLLGFKLNQQSCERQLYIHLEQIFRCSENTHK